MTAVILLIVVGTTIWVGVDASGRDWSDDGFANRPWKWVVGCLLLWIVVFPMYLVRRNRAGAGSSSTVRTAVPADRNGPVFWWGIASCVAMAIGAFGPWATVLGFSVRGVDGHLDGKLVIGLAVLGLLATLSGRSLALLTVLTGIAGVGTTFYDRHNIDSAISHAGTLGSALASVGWGLDLALVASVSLAIQGVVVGLRTQADTPAFTPTARTTVSPAGAFAAAGSVAATAQTVQGVTYTASGPAAGWYPDPYDELRLRYWTGDDWSDRTAELNSNGT